MAAGWGWGGNQATEGENRKEKEQYFLPFRNFHVCPFYTRTFHVLNVFPSLIIRIGVLFYYFNNINTMNGNIGRHLFYQFCQFISSFKTVLMLF